MKSDVSDLLELLEVVYSDATSKCVADVSDLRDLQTVRSRVEYEGISFLTITLPQFAKDLERALANGRVDATLFPRWKRAKGAVMPAFLQGMTRRIFDFETGEVINDESVPPTGGTSNDASTIIESIRQVCRIFSKVELSCSSNREAAAFESFVAIEQSFETFSVPESDGSVFRTVAFLLWARVFVNFDFNACTPKHGPGATAERFTPNGKFAMQRWHDRLEGFSPLVGSAFPLGVSPRKSLIQPRTLQSVTIVPWDREQPVRVVQVPKTLKSPRIIAIEPCCMQFVQQGIRDYLYDTLESDGLVGGHINFRDQSVNQRLALEASISGQLATIDLSDASDRVPHDLAMSMFDSCPDLRDMIESCRSTSAQLPNGQVISPLRKFASMGSALCFPIEAMYFYTLCVIALLESRNLAKTRANIENVGAEIFVYGDDIVVPAADATIVVEYLHKYRCKVNTSKSFWSGNFRESCGVDAFAGYEVTPIYLRKMRPTNMRQASRIISWVATANLFYKKGYWRTTRLIRNLVERVTGPLPYVAENSGVLGHISFLGYQTIKGACASRWNEKYQRLEIRALVPVPVYRTDPLVGYGALAKCLSDMERSDKDFSVHEWRVRLLSAGAEEFPLLERSLEQSVLRGAVALQRRWAPVQLG